MIKKIVAFDQSLFLKINKGCQNEFFDNIMPFVRESVFWIPLYLFMAIFILINFGKKVWGWLLLAGITILITDSISSKILKPLIARPRPCADLDFSHQVRLLAGYCGGNGSFTSSHAANHFGIAMFFFITLHPVFPKTIYLFFIWAATICFAQVYVGVHYPTDVLGGALLGLMVGSFIGKFHNKKFGPLQ